MATNFYSPLQVPADAAGRKVLQINADDPYKLSFTFKNATLSQRMLYAPVDGYIKFSRFGKDRLGVVTSPVHFKAQLKGGLEAPDIACVYIFDLSFLTTSSIRKKVFDHCFKNRFPKDSEKFKYFRRQLQKIKKWNYTESETYSELFKLFDAGRMRVPVKAGQSILELKDSTPFSLQMVNAENQRWEFDKNLTNSVQADLYFKQTLRYVDAQRSAAIKKNLVYDSLDKKLATRKQTEVRLQLTLDDQPIQNVKLYWMDKDGKNDHDLQKQSDGSLRILPNKYPIGSKPAAFMGEKPFQKGIKEKVTFPFSVADAKSVYASFELQDGKINGYFVPGRIGVFTANSSSTTYRYAGIQGKYLWDSSATDKVLNIPLLSSHVLKEGTLQFYVTSEVGYGAYKDLLVRLDIDWKGRKHEYFMQGVDPSIPQKFMYRLYNNPDAGTVQMRLYDKKTGQLLPAQPDRFNAKKMSLADFCKIKQKEFRFFTLEMGIDFKLIHDEGSKKSHLKYNLNDSTVWLYKQKDGQTQLIKSFKALGIFGGFSISPFFDFEDKKFTPFSYKLQIKQDPEGSQLFLSTIQEVIGADEGTIILNKYLNDVKSGKLLEKRNHYLSTTRKINLKSHTLELSIDHQGVKTLLAKVEVHITVKKSGEKHIRKTNAKGEIIFWDTKEIDLNKFTILVPAVRDSPYLTQDFLVNGALSIKLKKYKSALSLKAPKVHVHMLILKESNLFHYLSNIPITLWVRKKVGKGFQKRLLHSGKTDANGKYAATIPLSANQFAKDGQLYLELRTKGVKVGTVNLPDKISTLHLKADGLVNGVSLQDSFTKYPGVSVGSAANPALFQINHKHSVSVRFENNMLVGLQANYWAKLPPSMAFVLKGEKTANYYGEGLTDFSGKIQYEFIGGKPFEKIYLQLKESVSSADSRTFTLRHDDARDAYDLPTIKVISKGTKGVRSKAVEMFAGLPVGGFKVESETAFIIHLFKAIFEANTWLQLITADSQEPKAKPWKMSDPLDILYKQGAGTANAGNVITLFKKSDAWKRQTYIHEFAHVVDSKAFKPAQAYGHDHDHHHIFNSYMAFQEGWATFLGTYFGKDRTIVNYLTGKQKFEISYSPTYKDYKKKKGVKYDLSKSNVPAGRPKNLGESVEGAVAVLLLHLMHLVLPIGTLGKEFLTEQLEADIQKHPHLKGAANYFSSTSAAKRERFVKLIWKSVYNCQGDATKLVAALRQNANASELVALNKILKKLDMGQ
ncbi:MAG: hypothetical protein AAF990_02295 [Bacteroidota bacterium]